MGKDATCTAVADIASLQYGVFVCRSVAAPLRTETCSRSGDCTKCVVWRAMQHGTRTQQLQHAAPMCQVTLQAKCLPVHWYSRPKPHLHSAVHMAALTSSVAKERIASAAGRGRAGLQMAAWDQCGRAALTRRKQGSDASAAAASLKLQIMPQDLAACSSATEATASLPWQAAQMLCSALTCTRHAGHLLREGQVRAAVHKGPPKKAH